MGPRDDDRDQLATPDRQIGAPNRRTAVEIAEHQPTDTVTNCNPGHIAEGTSSGTQ